MFSEIGAMQGLAVPDPEKEISFDSFVQQYEEQAKFACNQKGWPESLWKPLAEIWAQTDLDIFKDIALAEGCSVKEAVEKMVKDINYNKEEGK